MLFYCRTNDTVPWPGCWHCSIVELMILFHCWTADTVPLSGGWHCSIIGLLTLFSCRAADTVRLSIFDLSACRTTDKRILFVCQRKRNPLRLSGCQHCSIVGLLALFHCRANDTVPLLDCWHCSIVGRLTLFACRAADTVLVSGRWHSSIVELWFVYLSDFWQTNIVL